MEIHCNLPGIGLSRGIGWCIKCLLTLFINISAVVDNKIAEFMKEVDLGSLLDRVGGLDTSVGWNWQVHVPLEKQRSPGSLF